MASKYLPKLSRLIPLLLCLLAPVYCSAQCDPSTPTFTLDLSGAPNSSSVTPTASRNGTCCGGNDPCVKIIVILNPNAMALSLVPTGADPGGALNYEFNCNGILYPGGTPVCLSGTGPQTLTICKPGGNPNSYSVTSIPKPNLPDSILVRNGCTQTLATTGFSVPTINWTSVPASTLHNSYLSCTSGCATVVVTPTNTPPAYVDYEVSGYAASPCAANFHRDTVRVYFYSDLNPFINPTNPTICYGGTTAVLTASATGGKTPYTYSWTTGSTAQTVTVGVGTYSVKVFDDTGCPPATATVQVTSFTLPIAAAAGTDQTVCKNNPTVALSGSITSASGGTWSANSGTFLPSTAALNATYVPAGTAVNSGSIELILGSTGNAGCPPDQDTVVVFFQNQPTITATSDQTVCANNNLSLLTANITGYAATAMWSAPGGGTLSPPVGAITSFSPTQAQVTSGSATVFVNTINNGACGSDGDTVVIIITPAPIVNAGPNQTICSTGSAQLSGSVTAAAFSGSWSTTGDGSFSAQSSLATAYTPGSGDIGTGTVNLILTSTNNGSCNPVSDTMRITISRIATVTASAPSPICSTTSSVSVSATVTGAAGTGSWSSSGSGTFGNGVSPLTSYALSTADRAGNTLTFTFTSTNNGPCAAVNSVATISIIPLATVSAGSNQVICSTQSTLQLSASQATVFGGTSTGSWTTGGSGTLNGASLYQTAAYVISNGDISSGLVTFTLTSTNNSVCPAVSDTVQMRIISSPTVLAGGIQPICSTAGNVALSGTITGGLNSNGLWISSGGGAFSPSASTLNTSYALTPADMSSGLVSFTLISSNNGPCAAQSNTTQVTVVSPATVNPGTSQLICSTQPTIALSGSVTGASGTGAWVTSGSGIFVPTNSASTGYSISAGDILAGTVQFTLISTGNGPCTPANGSVQLQITSQPTVAVSASQSLCTTSSTAAISGSVTSGTATWTSSGDGSFLPSSSAPSASYVPGSNDITNGSVLLTYASTNFSPCVLSSDTLRIYIQAPAQVDAGPPQLICASQGTIPLTGTVISAFNTGTWTSNGSGNFFPGNSAVTNYSISQGDITSGNVVFTLMSTNNGACPPQSHTTQVQITMQPSVTVSGSQTLCSSSNSALVSGTITGTSTNGNWTTSGNGQFTPSGSVASPAYIFGTSDINGGAVTLVLSTTGNAPCAETSDSLTIEVQSPATANAGTYQAVCTSFSNIALAGSVTGGLQTGQWSSSGTGTFAAGNTALNNNYVLSAGDAFLPFLTFTLVSTNNGACAASTHTTSVGVIRQVTVAAAPDFSICSNEPTVTLDATVTGNSAGLTWNTTGAGVLASPSSTSSAYSVAAGDINNQPVKFRITAVANGPCPAASDSILMYIKLRPVVNLKSDTSLCANQSPLELSSQITNGSGDVLWITTGTGSFSPTPFLANAAYHFSAADISTGTVQLSINSTDNGACGEVSASMHVEIRPSPKADFTASQYSVTLPADPVLFTNKTVGGNLYAWEISDGSKATTLNYTKDFTSVGYYTVTLAAENEYSCVDTIRKIITVISTVKFPTAFTPNGDKLNDIFRLYTDGVVEYEMNVYNRWGEMIFKSESLSHGWDGQFNGKACQQDVYVWTARIVFFDGRKFEQTGTISLIK